MVINKHNLAIASNCTAKPVKGYASDVLHLTDTGTLAVNGPYSVAVSAITPGNTGCITVDAANTILDVIGNDTVSLPATPISGKMPPTMAFCADKPVLFETIIEARHLLKLAQSAIDFEGEVIRLQFTGRQEPVRLDTRNTATGQHWEALLMPRNPGVDAERFAEDDFARALRLAASLA